MCSDKLDLARLAQCIPLAEIDERQLVVALLAQRLESQLGHLQNQTPTQSNPSRLATRRTRNPWGSDGDGAGLGRVAVPCRRAAACPRAHHSRPPTMKNGEG